MRATVPLGSLLAAALALAAHSPPAGAQLASNLGFNSLQPCRVIDTRVAGGALAGGTSREFHVVGGGSDFAAQGGQAGGCGVPGFLGGVPQAAAVLLNFVAVGPQAPGHLTAWPADQPMPLASVINFAPGLTVANAVAVPVRQDLEGGDIVVAAAGTTHVVADVLGYFAVAPSGWRANARRYCLSLYAVLGGDADENCPAGYHMASFGELNPTSPLQYLADPTQCIMGHGSGPPLEWEGWMGTIGEPYPSNFNSPGRSNCSLWSVSTGASSGTYALLNPSASGDRWIAYVSSCSSGFRTWCIED